MRISLFSAAAFAGLAYFFAPCLLLADKVPAQPITNVKTQSRQDWSEDADPFNITQLDQCLLFFACTNGGYALFRRSMADPRDASQPDAVVDFMRPGHRPALMRLFTRAQLWDADGANLAILGAPGAEAAGPGLPTKSTLYFHVPAQGLFASQGTLRTTRRVADVDAAQDNAGGRWLSSIVAYRPDVPSEARIFCNGELRSRMFAPGVELLGASGTPPAMNYLADVAPGSGDSFPYGLTVSDRTLYFAALDTASQTRQLFKCDGTNPPVLATSGLLDRPTEIAADRTGGVYFSNPAAGGSQSDIYLSIRTDGKAGTGAADDPFDASTADKFDAVLASYAGQTNIAVHLLAGSYQTHGCSPWRPAGTGWQMYKGWKLRGAGRDVTSVQWVLPAGSYSYANGDVRPIGVAFDGSTDSTRGDFCEVSDFTLDCNGTALTGTLVTGGITLGGSHSMIEHMRVKNWRAKGRGVECFVVNIRPESDQPFLTDATIRDVEVFQPAAATHGDGSSLIGLFGCHDSRMLDCYVHDCGQGAVNMPSYTNGFSLSGSVNVDFSGNRAVNFDGQSFYHDTGTGSGWQVHDNSFTNVTGGVVISTGTGFITQSSFVGNVITLRDQSLSYPKGIWFYCPNTPSSDLRIQGNSISMEGGTENNEATGIRLNGVTRSSLLDNVIDVKTAARSVECNSTKTTSITAGGNRTASGTALPAKAFDLGWAPFATLDPVPAASADPVPVTSPTPPAGMVSSAGRDLFFLDAAGNYGPISSDGINPAQLTYFHGGQMIFSANLGEKGNAGREVFTTSGGRRPALLHDINPRGGSDPAQFTNAGERWMYFTASDGTARKFFRTNGETAGLEQIKEANSEADILMDASCEIVPVMLMLHGQGTGRWVYFTGTPAGGTEPLLYRVDNATAGARAVRVQTLGGSDVLHAHHLAKFVAPAFGTWRLFFSCDGAGTEYVNPAGAPGFRPRGKELWCTEEAL